MPHLNSPLAPPLPPPSDQHYHFQQQNQYYDNSRPNAHAPSDLYAGAGYLCGNRGERSGYHGNNQSGYHGNRQPGYHGNHSSLGSPLGDLPHTIIYQPNPVPTSPRTMLHPCSPAPMSLDEGNSPMGLSQELSSLLSLPLSAGDPSSSFKDYLDTYINEASDPAHLLDLPFSQSQLSESSPVDSGDSTPLLGKRLNERLDFQVKIPRVVTSPFGATPTKEDDAHAAIRSLSEPRSNHQTQSHSRKTHSRSKGTRTSNGGTGTTGRLGGHLSDTSSGISSSSTKCSASSTHSSPSSSPCLVSSPFSYPSPPPLPPPPPPPMSRESEVPRIDPILEPHSGLGSREEYMKEDPLFPPSVPPTPLDLHPELPVYTVSV